MVTRKWGGTGMGRRLVRRGTRKGMARGMNAAPLPNVARPLKLPKLLAASVRRRGGRQSSVVTCAVWPLAITRGHPMRVWFAVAL